MRAGANRVVSPYHIGAVQMAQTAIRPAVVDFMTLATSSDNIELAMEEITIAAKSTLVDRSLLDANLRQRFGVIVVAIVGNAAEHSTAIIMALKNQMDLAVGIAMGSALQVALFVAPVLVFASYFRGEPMEKIQATPREGVEVVALPLLQRLDERVLDLVATHEKPAKALA